MVEEERKVDNIRESAVIVATEQQFKLSRVKAGVKLILWGK